MDKGDSTEEQPSSKTAVTSSDKMAPATAKRAAATFAPVIEFPELIFGLVGPIGVDLDFVSNTLDDSLKSFGYSLWSIRLTELMREVKSDVDLKTTSSVIESYNSKINYANDLREKYAAKDLLAALAIGAIRKLRPPKIEDEKSVPRTAFIIRQLKTPEEVRLLRRVYGRQFVLISIYGDPLEREEFLVSKIKIQSSGTIEDDQAREEARKLIQRDSKEDNEFGQNVSNAFHLGDVFADATDRQAASSAIERFIDALFGSNEITPTHDEYGMYLAKSAALRSADLSRQVGAALFSATGEIVSLGCNEVPKSGGGTYWTGDAGDSRDIRKGYDPNEINKVEIFADLISRLFQDEHLSAVLMEAKEPQEVVDKLFHAEGGKRYRDARIMDLIEFGRIIHAEMSTICDAARNGYSSRGASLYVTTFPCHLCAKHIVASGICKVIYLEPYPKSYARQLHSDSIQVEKRSDGSKVIFQPFIGISPYRYRDLFEKGRRKNAKGEAQKWQSDPRKPILDFVVPAHIEAETAVVARLAELLSRP